MVKEGGELHVTSPAQGRSVRRQETRQIQRASGPAPALPGVCPRIAEARKFHWPGSLHHPSQYIVHQHRNSHPPRPLASYIFLAQRRPCSFLIRCHIAILTLSPPLLRHHLLFIRQLARNPLVLPS